MLGSLMPSCSLVFAFVAICATGGLSVSALCPGEDECNRHEVGKLFEEYSHFKESVGDESLVRTLHYCRRCLLCGVRPSASATFEVGNHHIMNIKMKSLGGRCRQSRDFMEAESVIGVSKGRH